MNADLVQMNADPPTHLRRECSVLKCAWDAPQEREKSDGLGSVLSACSVAKWCAGYGKALTVLLTGLQDNKKGNPDLVVVANISDNILFIRSNKQ